MNGQKWVAWGLTGVALGWVVGGAPVHAQQGAPAQLTSAAAGKPAALVNGEAISMAELENMVNQDRKAVEVPEETRKAMRRQALSMLIDDTLMVQFLRANAPQVTEAAVDKQVRDMNDELKKQNSSVEAFCKEKGESLKQLREDLTSVLRWMAWAKGHISDADVQRYYQEYKDFFDGTTVHAYHIVLRLPPGATEADRMKAHAQLLELRKVIVAGKMDFATAAKTYSHCESSKNGGYLGFIPRKMMVDEAFARVAFSMQPNQISDVVQTDFGLHLIMVTERKPGQPSDFAKIKDSVRNMYTEEVRITILAQQRKAAKIEVFIP